MDLLTCFILMFISISIGDGIKRPCEDMEKRRRTHTHTHSPTQTHSYSVHTKQRKKNSSHHFGTLNYTQNNRKQ